jgi:hypothetical protein
VALSSVPGGSLIKAGTEGLQKIAGRIGRKNLKRIALGGVAAVGAGGVIAGARGPAPPGGAVMTPAQAGRSGHLLGPGIGRRRRMNPGNTKAMRRAIRRVEAGARLFHRFYAIKHGAIKGAHGVRMKSSRRRAA